ncbi:hypothetical protein MHYP_G00219360 [Metynnis hypsauchen]
MAVANFFRNKFRALREIGNSITLLPTRAPTQPNNSFTLNQNDGQLREDKFRRRNSTQSLFRRWTGVFNVRRRFTTLNPKEEPEEEPRDDPAYGLNVVSYNINGKKDLQEVVNRLQRQNSEDDPHVIFLQETCLGKGDTIALSDWDAYYTTYSDNGKGAAILVKKDERMKFKYYSQEVDVNGRYVVLRCSLKGQDFTFVCVYNHKDDTSTLELLSPYLEKVTVGALVVGGDFNTTLRQSDRAKGDKGNLKNYPESQRNPQHEKIRPLVEQLMDHHKLVDVFAECDAAEESKHTFSTRNKNKEQIRSRLDYFFMPKQWQGLFTKCAVLDDVANKDHRPLLLKLNTKDRTDEEITEAMQALELGTAEEPGRGIQNISGVEIVAAIHALELNKVQRPDGALDYSHLNDKTVDRLKREFSGILSTSSLPENFANDKYLILAQILAQRLENWGSTLSRKKRRNSQTSGRRQSSQQQTEELETVDSAMEAEWSDLDLCIKKKLEGHPGSESCKILENMLPRSESTGRIILRKRCPLTPILCELLQEYGSDPHSSRN